MNFRISFESVTIPVSICLANGVSMTVKPVAPLVSPVHIEIDVSREEE